MGCVETADITEEEIVAAKEDHERVQKFREKKAKTVKKRMDFSRFSKTAKSFNITATPSMVDVQVDMGHEDEDGNTLDIDNDKQSKEAIITKNSNILCLIYSFDKLLPIATFDPVLDTSDMTSNEAMRYFGGENRTQRLAEHFNAIRAKTTYEINNEIMERTKEVFIISDTLKVGQIRSLLEKVGLLDKIVGAPDINDTKLVNDHIIGTDHRFMSETVSKNIAVFKILQEKKYAHDQILFVDNAKSVVEYFNSISLCRTILVKDEYGIGSETCLLIENMFDKRNATTELTLEPAKPLDLHVDEA